MHALTGAAPVLRPIALNGARAGVALQALLLCGLALAVRLSWLDAAPHIDELYHLLAAEGWLSTGEPRIAGGVYERASLFTILVGLSLETLGPGMPAARLPALAAGIGLVGAIFLWVRAVAGPGAAWAAGLLMALSPLAVELSQLARFYTLHALVFWLAVIAVFHVLDAAAARTTRVAAGLFAVLAWPVAFHLQVLTVVGGLGLALWLAGGAAPAMWRRLRVGRPAHLLLAAGGLVALGGAAALALEGGLVARLVHELRHTPLWAREYQNQVHFYHFRLAQQYPVLWPLTGVAVLAALAARPRAASLCVLIFGTGFAVGSLGGMKDDRYLFYVLPFLFTIWGIAIATLAGGCVAAIRDLAKRVRRIFAPALPAAPLGLAAGLAALAFALSAGSAPFKLAVDLAQGEQPDGTGRISGEWWAAAPELRPLVAAASVVVVSDELAALAALGRADVVVSASRLSDSDAFSEFSRDPRTGATMISEPASLGRVMRCAPDGILIFSERDLQNAWAVPEATYQEVRRRARPLAATGGPALRAFAWSHERTTAAGCALPIARVLHRPERG
ncbi:MAG TPA: hypothetical protein VFZ01_20420 [Geminicoccaceae bacterium]